MEPSPSGVFARRLWAAVAGLLAILALPVTASIVTSRRQHEQQALVEAFSVSRALGSELAGLAGKLRLALVTLTTERERQLAALKTDDRALGSYAGSFRASLPEVRAIRLADATGRVILQDDFASEPAPDVGELPFFSRLRESRVPDIVISRPYPDGPGGPRVVAFARRIEAPDASFAGAAVVLLSVDSLVAILGAAEAAPGGAIRVLDEDLRTLARHPPVDLRAEEAGVPKQLEEILRLGLVSGTMRAVSPIDGVERLYAYRKVAGYPMHVMVGRSTSECLGHWCRDMGVVAMLAGVLAGVTILATAMVHRAWREQRRAARVLEEQAHTDDLTGLANRRRFFEMGEAELSRARRYGTVPSMLMLDIDRFKDVNDAHGHRAGDRVLQQLARISRDVLRQEDLLGRVGGEEFAILLPETGGEGAVEVAERLREAVEDSTVPCDEGTPIRYTVSIGVSTLGRDMTMDTLMSQSDAALYEAKRGGRNRVRAFPRAS